MELLLDLAVLREQLEAESALRVFNLARDVYDLDVNENLETKAEMIDLILAKEYELAFK